MQIIIHIRKKDIMLLLIGIAIFGGSVMLYAGTVTIPNTFSSATTAKASEVNANFTAIKTAVDDNASNISTLEATKPAFRVRHNTAQVITTTASQITWEVEDFDKTNAFASNQFTVATAGLYYLHASVYLAGDTGNLAIYKNSSLAMRNHHSGTTSVSHPDISYIVDAAVGDVFDVYLYMDSGSAATDTKTTMNIFEGFLIQ